MASRPPEAPPLEADEVRRQVAVRFGSVHAFAKERPGGLARSTVYLVLSGSYSGNSQRQLERIRAALGEDGGGIFDILKRVACRRCRKKRRRSRQCEKCFALWREQEKAIAESWGQGDGHDEKKQNRPNHQADPVRLAGL
jgi:hypothetical protein